jgi:hypothetical protein
VYLVAVLGANVLFQDADVVWFKDPLEYFVSQPKDIDSFWMDDGARSTRYAPFFANSGFYYLRANAKNRNFMHALLLSFDQIMTVRSHQHVLDRLLGQHAATFGVRADVLSKETFPQGQVFHHNKGLMKEFADLKKLPVVFHMCWTASKVDKLKYMKQVGHWFLKDTCTEETLRSPNGIGSNSAALKDCCDASAVAWRPAGKYPVLSS